MPNLPSARRIPQLDLLRGIAVLLVIVDHSPCSPICSVGWIGVDLFFVLSGFLISGLLFKEFQLDGSISIWRFLVRRGMKIYPGFYALLALTTLMHPTFLGPRLWHEALFIQNYTPHFWGHTWSLAVEEHFYVALPILLCLLGKERLKWIPKIAIGAMIACVIMRICSSLEGATNEQIMYPTHLRFDALLFGVCLSYYYAFHRAKFEQLDRWWFALMGLGLVSLNLFDPSPTPLIQSLLTSTNTIGFGCILVWVIMRPSIRFPLLEQIGFYSYSIYLWHMLVAGIFRQHTITLLSLCGDVLAAVALGVTMAVIVEMPMLRLRDKIFPSNLRVYRAGSAVSEPT